MPIWLNQSKVNHFIIEQSPISVNRAFVGRKVKTPEYRSFLELAAWELKSQKPRMFSCPICVEIILHLKNVTRSDIDNRIKSILDAGTMGGLWKDDSQIYELLVVKTKSPKDWVEIKIDKYYVAN